MNRTETIDFIISELQGSGNDIAQYEEDYQLTIRELGLIDDAIFQCVCCGWWFDTAETSERAFDEMVCRYCEDDYADNGEIDEY